MLPHKVLTIVMAIFLFKVLQFLPSWHHQHADIVWQPADWAEGCVAFGASFPARSVDFGWKPVHQATRWCRTSVWSSTLCYKLVLGRCQRKLKGLTGLSWKAGIHLKIVISRLNVCIHNLRGDNLVQENKVVWWNTLFKPAHWTQIKKQSKIES